MDESNRIYKGVCRYCGQLRAVRGCETVEEANRAATLLCDCPEAGRTQKLERAKERIAGLFYMHGEVLCDWLEQCVTMVQDGTLEKIVLKIDEGTKAEIKINSKGALLISKTETRNEQRTL